MKYLFMMTIILSFNLGAQERGLGDHPSVQSDSTTTRGTSPTGPDTLEHPISPTSGSTRHRSPHVGGEDTSPASHMSHDEDQNLEQAETEKFGIETEHLMPEEEEAENVTPIGEAFSTGPYQDGEYNERHDTQRREAQELE